VQEFIREANGTDIRALVIGGEVVAATKRIGRPGDFRANVHRGGTAMQVDLSNEERRIAVKAATALGLNVSGVDMVRSSRGPLVMEVNSSPGLEGIEGATGIDIASRIIDFLETNACYGGTETKGVG
jgi:ribosomal protein S6--L-glutamate ligase